MSSLLEKSSSSELSRRTSPFYAKKQSYGLGQQVQIEVDLQREFIDFENSRLVFDLEWTNGSTGATTTTSPWAASQIIKNLRVKTLSGQMIGHEVREYRAWAQMVKELKTSDDLAKSYEAAMEGAVANSTVTNDADYSVRYAHKFMTHLFSVKEYYPAHFHQGLMIEFDIPSATAELFSSDTTLPVDSSVQIVNAKYVADLVQLKPDIESKMVKLMEEQKLFVDYEEVLTQENTISTGSFGSYDIVGIDGRVKNIFQYQVRDDSRNASGEDYWRLLSRNGLTSYRFKLGANYLNYESIKINTSALLFQQGEQVMELCKALDGHDKKFYHSSMGDALLTPAALDTDRFVVGVKVDKAQKNTCDTISSMVDKDRNNVRVELNGTVGAAATSYTHVQLDKRIQILSGSIVRNVRS